MHQIKNTPNVESVVGNTTSSQPKKFLHDLKENSILFLYVLPKNCTFDLMILIGLLTPVVLELHRGCCIDKLSPLYTSRLPSALNRKVAFILPRFMDRSAIHTIVLPEVADKI